MISQNIFCLEYRTVPTLVPYEKHITIPYHRYNSERTAISKTVKRSNAAFQSDSLKKCWSRITLRPRLPQNDVAPYGYHYTTLLTATGAVFRQLL
jgi:hypothetical protein